MLEWAYPGINGRIPLVYPNEPIEWSIFYLTAIQMAN